MSKKHAVFTKLRELRLELSCVLACCTLVTTANAADQSRKLTGLDAYIESVREDWDNVGASVAVVQGTDVIYSRGFGLRQQGRPEKVDADTLFQIGSTTKAFTTAALGMLVDDGKVRWDSPVTDYLPTFTVEDPWITRNLTVRDVVSHRSGYVERPYFALDVMNSKDALSQMRYATSSGAFRDSFLYSNLMYATAGAIIESASGMSWGQFVKQRVLEPLGMSRTATSLYELWDEKYVAPTFVGFAPEKDFSLLQARDRDVAMPHGWDEKGAVVVLPWRSYDNSAAAGSLVSSATDMAKWLLLQLNGGQFDGKQLIKTATLDEIHATQNLHVGPAQFPFADVRETYAMAWRKGEYLGHVHLAHSGGIIGFPAYVALLPDERIGVVVLSNGPKSAKDEYTFHKAIAFWIMDRLVGASQRDWRKEFLQQWKTTQAGMRKKEADLQSSRVSNSVPSLPLDQYVGQFQDVSGHSGVVSVELEKDRLKLSFSGVGAYRAYLDHWDYNTFRFSYSPGLTDLLGPQFVTFNIAQTGRVASISMFDATFRSVSTTEHPDK